MNEIITYENFFEVPANYKLEKCIFTAMSMDYKACSSLLSSIRKSNFKRNLAKCLFFVQRVFGSGLSEWDTESFSLLNSNTRIYTGEAPCFHAKLIIAKYRVGKETECYRIAVLSNNITINNEYQNIIMTEGKIGDSQTEDGERLWEYIQYCSDKCTKNLFSKDASASNIFDFSSIRNLELAEGEHIYFNGVNENETLYSRVFAPSFQEMDIISKSYFVGDSYQKLVKKPNVRIWNCWDGTDGGRDQTHMKMYLVKRDTDVLFYSGSANCSTPALGGDSCNQSIPFTNQNVECLMEKKIDENEKDAILLAIKNENHEIQKAFPAPLAPEHELHDIKRTAIEEILKHMTFQWVSKDTKYVLKVEGNYDASVLATKVCISDQGNALTYEWYIQILGSKKKYCSNDQAIMSESKDALIAICLFEKDRCVYSHPILPIGMELVQCNPIEQIFVGIEEDVLYRELLNKDWISLFLQTDVSDIQNQFEDFYQTYSEYEEVLTTSQKKALLPVDLFIRNYQGQAKTVCAKNHIASNYPYDFGLKNYQLQAVKNIEEAYKKNNSYVVADEAGLGKTFVALQLIANIYAMHKDGINVYYMCSNKRILSQNGKKIKEKLESMNIPVHMEDCDRLSEVFHIEKKQGHINFYTMSTSLLGDTFSSYGNVDERTIFLNKEKKNETLEIEVEKDQKVVSYTIDAYTELTKEERKVLYQYSGDGLFDANKIVKNPVLIDVLCKKNPSLNEWIRVNENKQKYTEGKDLADSDFKNEYSKHFQQIRQFFNRYSMKTNSPNLIILDEFHRMGNGGDDPFKELQELKLILPEKTKLLYLSATPFCVSLQGNVANSEDKEDEMASLNFENFIELVAPSDSAKAIRQMQEEYRSSIKMLCEKPSHKSWKIAQLQAENLSNHLRDFMGRNERFKLSNNLDAENYDNQDAFEENVAWAKKYHEECLKGKYEKLVPGMSSYKFLSAAKGAKKYSDIVTGENGNYLWEMQSDICTFDKGRVYANPYLRAVYNNSVKGANTLLWVPPSKRYYEPSTDSVFARQADFSKLLIFANWYFIPRAVSSIFSQWVNEDNAIVNNNLLELDFRDLTFDEIMQEVNMWDLSEPVTMQDIIKKGWQEALGRPDVCLARLIKRNASKEKELIITLKAEIGSVLSDYMQYITSRNITLQQVVKGCQKVEDYEENLVKIGKGLSKSGFGYEIVCPEDNLQYQIYTVIAKYESKLYMGAASYSKEIACLFWERYHIEKSNKSKIYDFTEQWDSAELDSWVETVNADSKEKCCKEILALFKSYINRPEMKAALYKSGVACEDKLLDYFVNGNIQAMLEEYLFVCDGSFLKMMKSLKISLTGEYSVVHVQTTGAEEKIACGFSERFTDNPEDKAGKINEAWQQDAQIRFNSPFWPMVMTTTSIAQEGLDFHAYCRKIMHYTLPNTPMAMEQREGRIDRHCGFIQRIRQAGKFEPQVPWKDIFCGNDEEDATGIIPGWVVPKSRESDISIERIIPYLPTTAEYTKYQRMVKLRKEYRGILGLPNEENQLWELTSIAQQLGNPLHEIFPDLMK